MRLVVPGLRFRVEGSWIGLSGLQGSGAHLARNFGVWLRLKGGRWSSLEVGVDTVGLRPAACAFTSKQP